MRNTRQKDIILQAVKAHGCHPSAEELYALLKPEHPRLSLATVYRNLNQFAELGELRRISISGEPMRFDGQMETHTHAICERCGCIIDLFDDEFAKQLHAHIQKVQENSFFKVQSAELLYQGLCEDCAALESL